MTRHRVCFTYRSMTHHFSFMHRRGPVDLFLEFYQALIVSSLNLWTVTLVCLFSLRCRWTTAYLIYWLSFNCLFVFSHKFISHHSCFACFSLIECAADPKSSYRMACRTCFLFSENQPLFLKQSANRYRYRITKAYRYRITKYKTYLSHSFPHILSLRLKTNTWCAVTLF